jgi:hypothetical protein
MHMMGASETRRFKTKKAMREDGIGTAPDFEETSMFGVEYKGDGEYVVVGPHPYQRTWFAKVMVRDGKIAKVS